MNAKQPTVSAPPSPALVWERLPDLPDPVGWKGMFGGVSNGQILLAGGSNFPIPHRKGGSKNLGRQIYVRSASGDAGAGWEVAHARLPAGMGEGASVSAPEGVIGLGGLDSTGPTSRVFLLAWEEGSGTVQMRDLPALPEPCSNAAAVRLRGKLYVAGGDRNGRGLSHFWRLDLAAALAGEPGVHWETLPTWPGPARFGAVLAVLEANGREQLFLFGGRMEAVGASSLDEYLSEFHRFDPAAGEWAAMGGMPDRALLPGAVRIGRSRLAIMGGSNGHSLERMAELGERYRIPNRIMVYDANTDSWMDRGEMPIGVVAPAVVETDSGWIVAGGEYSPGLRTAQAFRLTLNRLDPSQGKRER